MGAASQRKGRRGELELCHLLSKKGYHVRPGEALNFGGEPDLLGMKGIHVEIKRRECPDIPAALAQAERDAEFFSGGEDIPAVFTRGNGQQWRVVMTLDSFLRLYQLSGLERKGAE